MARSVGRLYSAVFPGCEPAPDLRPPRVAHTTKDAIRLRWLGTAGFIVESATTTLLIDPYLTRAPLSTLVASPLVPDESAIRAHLPARVDAVLCGHSHFDHLLDAPLIAALRGAKLVGSETTSAFGRAQGLSADQIVTVGGRGATLSIGDFEVRFVASLHARILFGRVPFPGTVSSTPRLPARAWAYRMGGAFGIIVRHRGVSIYHNGSADLVDAQLAGEHAQILLAGIAGRQTTNGYLSRLTGLLRPKVVIPAHHDAFFAPLEAGLRLLPGIDLHGFVAETKRVAPNATIVLPLYEETLAFGPSGGNVGVVAEQHVAP